MNSESLPVDARLTKFFCALSRLTEAYNNLCSRYAPVVSSVVSSLCGAAGRSYAHERTLRSTGVPLDPQILAQLSRSADRILERWISDRFPRDFALEELIRTTEELIEARFEDPAEYEDKEPIGFRPPARKG